MTLETGYLQDLANNIVNTGRHSLGPVEVLLLIDEIITLRGGSLELTDSKSNDVVKVDQGVDPGHG
jgi:hypothetical protein